jgi:hypothetical protein
MTTVTTTLVSGQNAYVGAISSRGEYSVSVNSGVQGPAGNTGANGVSITAANVASGNLVLTFSNSATIDVGSVVGANGAAGANGANGAAANTGNVTFANTTIGTSSVNTSLVIQTRNVNPSSSPAINSTSSWTFGYNGDLTLPGQMLFPEGTTLYNNGMTVSANVGYTIRAYGNTGGADLQWFANSANMGTTRWNAVRLNSPEAATEGTIVLSAGQFVATKNWEFRADGNLTTPGNIVFSDTTVQTTAFTTSGSYTWANTQTFSNTVTFNGNINVNGNTNYFSSNNIVYTDALVEVHAPPGGVGNTWTTNDTNDIGLRFHYYNGADKNAGLFLDNGTWRLKWVVDGTETAGQFTHSGLGDIEANVVYANVTGTASSANNAAYLGGIAAAQYAYANQVSAGSTNVAAQFAWTNSHTFSNSVTFSGSAVVPSSNTLGTALGSTTQRWVLIANTGTFSGAVSGVTTLATGNTTITGFANVTSTIQGGSSLIIAGAASGITTLAAGNTTITGFANVTSTIQGGASLIIAGAASGITTLAAGNTTITGFANVSTTLNVTGNTTLSGTNTYITGTNTYITSNVYITANVTITGNVTGNTAGFAIGYRDVPQNFTNTSLTLALTDAGKHILTQNSGSSTQTVTIPPNATIAFQTGTAITIIVQSTGTVAVANGAGVTMYLTGNSTAKSTVTLNSYSMATLLKIGTDTWMVSGTGAT